MDGGSLLLPAVGVNSLCDVGFLVGEAFKDPGSCCVWCIIGAASVGLSLPFMRWVELLVGVAYLVLSYALGVAYSGYGFPMGVASWIAGLLAGQAFYVHVLWMWQVGVARCVWSSSGHGLLCSLLCSGVA